MALDAYATSTPEKPLEVTTKAVVVTVCPGPTNRSIDESIHDDHEQKISKENILDVPVTLDPDLVGWDGDHDPSNPQNWSRTHKWAMTAVLAVFMLAASMSASMVAPCLADISAELHIRDAFVSQMVMSAYVLSWGVGPLFIGPLSEIYGRSVVLQVSNVVYLAFNLACGFSRHAAELVVFRVLSGLGASAPLGLYEGVLGDIWPPEELGRAIAIENPVFFLHHAQLDRLWKTWQARDPPGRLHQIKGKAATGAMVAVSPDDVLHFAGLFPDVKVRDVMDMENGLLCYNY